MLVNEALVNFLCVFSIPTRFLLSNDIKTKHAYFPSIGIICDRLWETTCESKLRKTLAIQRIMFSLPGHSLGLTELVDSIMTSKSIECWHSRINRNAKF